MRGLSLVEVLLVVGIVAILISLTLPLGLDFYRNQQLGTTVEEVVQVLRRTQLKAMSIEGDSSFGVYFGTGSPGQYSLFKGESYAAKTEEEVFDAPDDIVFSGISELTFSKLTGIPSVTGNVVLTLGNKTETITINSQGRIEW